MGDGGEVVRVEERFEHRKDRLQLRVTDHRGGTVTCTFDQGLATGLREYRVVQAVGGVGGGGGRREYRFWEGSRVDGLVRRVEEVERKVVEEYEDRDDRLVYRSITVDNSGQWTGGAGGGAGQRGKAFSIAIGGAGGVELPIRKLTEKYARDAAVHAERDVVKRTHWLVEGLIGLRYAECEGRLEGSEWIIDKNDKLETTEGAVGGGGGVGGVARVGGAGVGVGGVGGQGRAGVGQGGVGEVGRRWGGWWGWGEGRWWWWWSESEPAGPQDEGLEGDEPRRGADS